MVVGWSDGRIPVDERIESPFFFFVFFGALLLSDSSLVVLSWSSDLLDERYNRDDKKLEDDVGVDDVPLLVLMDAAD